MKRSIKAKAKRGAKRDLFAELSEGMQALAHAALQPIEIPRMVLTAFHQR